MSRHTISLGFDVVLPIVLGILFVLNIMLMVLVPIVWIALLSVRANSRRDRQLSPLPIAGCLLSVLLFGTIVFAAASYEPTKTKLQHLSREITFPTQDVELAELAFLTSRLNESRQFTIRFSFPDADRHKTVRLPETTVTVKQLLDAIERDTGMTGRFHSCGNGYSVLQGEDCGFGLYVNGKYFTNEEFDLFAYADDRFKRLSE
ncbi:hypothetical protein AB1K70_01295 [Bremerella sp. JC770]|uniref:hypothetical protein n=1 Tax=Bremerella sp. JC770 TaxID=3232137 RepID=UPI003457691C